MADTPTSDAQRLAATRLRTLADTTETPESLGRFLYRYVMTEGVAKGQLSDDGRTVTIPFEVTVTLPAAGATGSGDTARKVVTKNCWTAFGAELLCFQQSYEET